MNSSPSFTDRETDPKTDRKPISVTCRQPLPLTRVLQLSRLLVSVACFAFACTFATSIAKAGGDSATETRTANDVYETYGRLLETYVRDGGVDYAAWSKNKADFAALQAFVGELSEMDPSGWTRERALSYWINVYNAVTVNLIVENYPVESIKDLGGLLKKSPWDRKLITIGGKELSLNEVENEIIRPTFEDARIHFALN